ncbi:MAG: hypothetical protein HY518_00890 [Candidatus Aenigmarchaeota archaeon]|nr:hypothetical protein [Candidatus Aenigmarchaeota archaeon]
MKGEKPGTPDPRNHRPRTVRTAVHHDDPAELHRIPPPRPGNHYPQTTGHASAAGMYSPRGRR